MKIDIMGASNTAISMYRDLAGQFRQTPYVNLQTVLAERMECEVDSHIALTVAKINDDEKCYAECASLLLGGDALILQGRGNDAAFGVMNGEEDSLNISEYYGALNHISQQIKNKYKTVLFTTGFNVNKLDDYCEYNHAIKNVALKNGFQFIDFFNDERFSGAEMLPDNEHMSEEALFLYTDILIERLRK